MRCPERYPDEVGVQCRLEVDQPHPEHCGGYGDDWKTWDNTSYVPQDDKPEPVSNKSKLLAMAKRLAPRK
jgi:hypothetical protein